MENKPTQTVLRCVCVCGRGNCSKLKHGKKCISFSTTDNILDKTGNYLWELVCGTVAKRITSDLETQRQISSPQVALAKSTSDVPSPCHLQYGDNNTCLPYMLIPTL